MKKIILFLLFAALGIFTIVATTGYLRKQAEELVEAAAVVESLPWLVHFPKSLPPSGAFHVKDTDPDLVNLARLAGDYGLVADVSIYNASGKRVLFQSDPTIHKIFPKGALDALPKALQKSLNGNLSSRLIAHPSDTTTPMLGQVVAPLVRGDTVIGSIVVTRNISSLWLSINDNLNRIVTFTGLFIILFLLLPYLMILRRHRLKQVAEWRVNFLAKNDPLTGLPNREYFIETLENAVAKAIKDEHRVALFVINLDKFRDLNTTFGRAVGDELIKIVAVQLRRAIRRSDQLCRLGGGEFAVLAEGSTDDVAIRTLGETLIDSIRSVTRVRGNDIRCSASVAVTIAPSDGSTAEALMSSAHLAVERAKAEGRASLCFFEPDMDLASRNRKQMEQDLKVAIVRHELQTRYQPQFDISTGDLVGFEALVRWEHPIRGLISPAEFIPVAEESNLIIEIGEWVLKRSCIDALEWADPVKVAVNLSPAQFEGENVAMLVADMLDQTGLPPQRLEIEITESLLMDKTQKVVDTLRDLSAMGVRVAMDDFGTGYSSLATLSRLSFNKIKLDRSFIIMMESQKGSEAIIQFVVKLGESLGVDVLAEGVETWQQSELLRSLGCYLVQGYYFGKPLKQDEVMVGFTEGHFRRATRGPEDDLDALPDSSSLNTEEQANIENYGSSGY